MRELGPQLSTHKEEKPHIEKFLKVIEDESFLKRAAVAFFSTFNQYPDGSVSETPSPLTEEEYNDFKIFFLHVAKRIISATSQKLNGCVEYGVDKKTKVTDLEKMNEQERETYFRLFFHDLSHSVGQITKHGAMTNITAVQPFLRYKQGEEYNVKEILEDELRGFIFGSLYYPAPYGNRSKMNLFGTRTYEEFKTSYLKNTMRGALKDNFSLINDATKNSYDDHIKGYELAKQAENIADEIVKNPPEDVVLALTYIWEHRDNPRVLVDLFFKEVGPYITELQKRKAYQDVGNKN